MYYWLLLFNVFYCFGFAQVREEKEHLQITARYTMPGHTKSDSRTFTSTKNTFEYFEGTSVVFTCSQYRTPNAPKIWTQFQENNGNILTPNTTYHDVSLIMTLEKLDDNSTLKCEIDAGHNATNKKGIYLSLILNKTRHNSPEIYSVSYNDMQTIELLKNQHCKDSSLHILPNGVKETDPLNSSQNGKIIYCLKYSYNVSVNELRRMVKIVMLKYYNTPNFSSTYKYLTTPIDDGSSDSTTIYGTNYTMHLNNDTSDRSTFSNDSSNTVKIAILGLVTIIIVSIIIIMVIKYVRKNTPARTPTATYECANELLYVELDKAEPVMPFHGAERTPYTQVIGVLQPSKKVSY